MTIHDNTAFGRLRPAIEEIEARHGLRPEVLPADSGFCSKTDTSFAHQAGVVAIVPSNTEKKRGLAAYATDNKADVPGIGEWRERMVASDTRKTYDPRCRIECVFAQMRNRGLRLSRLRGRDKVKAEALIHLPAHNMLCGDRLRLAAAWVVSAPPHAEAGRAAGPANSPPPHPRRTSPPEKSPQHAARQARHKNSQPRKPAIQRGSFGSEPMINVVWY